MAKRGPKKRRGGRPTDYQARYADDVRMYLLTYENATDEDLAKFFGVSISTLYLWKAKHKKFSEAVHDGKVRFKTKVGGEIYNAALGRWITEERMGPDGEVVQLRKFLPGDVGAMKFILTNRTKDWRDKQETVHSNPDGSGIGPTAAQLEQARLLAEFVYEKTEKERLEAASREGAKEANGNK